MRQRMSVRIPPKDAPPPPPIPGARRATPSAIGRKGLQPVANRRARFDCSPLRAAARTRTKPAGIPRLLFPPVEPCFAKFCQRRYDSGMSTMNISLPDSLKDFVDEQVNERGYGTSSEYVRELIRKDKDRLRLRGLLLAGAESAPTKPVDEAYFDRLRRKIKSAKPGARR